jgi:hypothetical protein
MKARALCLMDASAQARLTEGAVYASSLVSRIGAMSARRARSTVRLVFRNPPGMSSQVGKLRLHFGIGESSVDVFVELENGSPNSAPPLDSATARELLSLLKEMAGREERASVRQGGLIAFVRSRDRRAWCCHPQRPAFSQLAICLRRDGG